MPSIAVLARVTLHEKGGSAQLPRAGGLRATELLCGPNEHLPGPRGADVRVPVSQWLHFRWTPCGPWPWTRVPVAYRALPPPAARVRLPVRASPAFSLVPGNVTGMARHGEPLFTEGRRMRFTERERLALVFSEKVVFTVKEGT